MSKKHKGKTMRVSPVSHKLVCGRPCPQTPTRAIALDPAQNQATPDFGESFLTNFFSKKLVGLGKAQGFLKICREGETLMVLTVHEGIGGKK